MNEQPSLGAGADALAARRAKAPVGVDEDPPVLGPRDGPGGASRPAVHPVAVLAKRDGRKIWP